MLNFKDKSLVLNISKILFSVFFIIFWILIIRANIHRIGSFSFFDEYSTYVTGFFMLKGRTLFTDIFLNHQPLLSHISYYIQLLSKPQSFYELAQIHRISVIVFSLICSIGLVIRFRFIGMAFTIFFELTKFYLFGSLFLAESFIVYPIAYMTVLIILSSAKKLYITTYDIFLSAFLTWFVIFMREPYIPLVIVQFGIILSLARRTEVRKKLISAGLLLVLSFITLVSHPLKEYFYQVVTLNSQTVASSELKGNSVVGTGLLKMFFYPIYILVYGEQNFFRGIQILLSLIFIFLFAWVGYKHKKYRLLLYIFILLGLANIRFVDPGQIYFVAFHMLIWMSVFLASIFSFLYLYMQHVTFKKSLPILLILAVVLGLGFFHKDAFVLSRVNKETEFNDNYHRFMVNGQIIKNLSNPSDRLFVDMSDSLLHYHSGLDSSYRYAFYYPVMSGNEMFKAERQIMFRNSPPEFYYYNCEETGANDMTTMSIIRNKYAELSKNGVGMCLFIRRDILMNLPQSKIDTLLQFQYTTSER
jgi:hypothetical protein